MSSVVRVMNLVRLDVQIIRAMSTGWKQRTRVVCGLVIVRSGLSLWICAAWRLLLRACWSVTTKRVRLIRAAVGRSQKLGSCATMDRLVFRMVTFQKMSSGAVAFD
jgi:hypothetical protein